MLKASTVDLWKEEGMSFSQEADLYERKLKMFVDKRKRIYDMREDGSYSKEEFTARKQQIDNEITAVKISMSEANIQKHDLAGALSFGEQFLVDLSLGWRSVPDPLKFQFQKLVFPDGVPYRRGQGFGTAKLGLIFELSKASERREKILVAGAGLEPAISWL